MKPGMGGFSGSRGIAPPNSSGGPGAQGASGLPQDAMIQLKVDPAKLPKAEELKALMFPGTLAVVVDDQSVRFVSRESFPNLVSGVGMGAIGGALLAPAIQAARASARAAAGMPPSEAAPLPGGFPGAAQPPPGAAAPPPAAGAAPRGPAGPRGQRPGGKFGGGRGADGPG
jgi:hypothetical protein